MLLHFSKVLPRYTTKDGVCARLSGDKFILLCSYREKETLERRISVITEELKRFSFPGSSPFQLDILIGISLIEGNTVPINAAIDRALFALSALKERQTSGSLYYDEVLRSELLEESELEKVFAKAIKDGEFYVVLQPKYSLQTRRLVGCEALVRWDHPGKGRLAPSQFIPLLEKHNLLVTLDMFVLEHVCTLIKGWQNKGPIMSVRWSI
jgi:predicted signal transduction protein with EAL and GGDEF domain